MTTPPSSATDLGAAFVAALTERDFGRLADTLAPDVRIRALIPPGPADFSGAMPAAARFASWFGELDRLELVLSGTDEIADRLHIFYRLRTKRSGDPWKIIEQHLLCALELGRIGTLDLVCSGFRPEPIRPTLTGRESRAGGLPSSIRLAAQLQPAQRTRSKPLDRNCRSSSKEATP